MSDRKNVRGQFLGAIHDIDLRHIRVFMAVVERRSFAAASADLNIGRSTISIQFSNLEKRLGLTLCERGPNHFRLTEQGEIVYQAAIELCAAIDNFQVQVNAAHQHLVGDIKIGYMDQLGTHPDFKIHSAIRDFHEMAPKVKLTLRVTPMDELERLVMNETLDVAIIADYRVLPHLEYRDFLIEEQRLYCGVGHRLFNHADGAIPMEQIIRNNFASSGYAGPNMVLDAGTEVMPTAIAYSAEALVHLVLTGDFLAFVPVHYAEQWEKQGIMRAIRPDILTVRKPFKIIQKKGRILGDVTNQFVQLLTAPL